MFYMKMTIVNFDKLFFFLCHTIYVYKIQGRQKKSEKKVHPLNLWYVTEVPSQKPLKFHKTAERIYGNVTMSKSNEKPSKKKNKKKKR